MMEAEVVRLKDLLQVADMRYSEVCARQEIDYADMQQLKKNSSYYRRKMSDALQNERDANERESEMRRQVQLAERDTRKVEFRNLALERRLASFRNAVPLHEHEKLKSALELRVTQQDEQIASLRDQ